MPKICYQTRGFKPETLARIELANEIIDEYRGQGYTLTVRQLYYQFVARDLIANNVREYGRLKDFVNDGRLAGLIDWEAIEDRTRGVDSRTNWGSPAEIVDACARGYVVDLWARQPVYVEVWVEKEALVGVFERVCRELSVPWLACRGYVSQSEMWRAATERFAPSGRRNVVLHFGDHDPSGIDMSRDIGDRLALFGADVEVRRLALNFDQIEEYAPPPNPAKTTDARFDAYRERFGTSSWELDALEPRVLVELVERAVDELRDPGTWAEDLRREGRERGLLERAARDWEGVVEYLHEDAPWLGEGEDS